MEDTKCNSVTIGPHKRYRKDDTPQPHKRYRHDVSPDETYLEEVSEEVFCEKTQQINSTRIMYERSFIVKLRNNIVAESQFNSFPCIPGVTKIISDTNCSSAASTRTRPLFYAIARGPAKLGVFSRSEIWDASDQSGFKKDGGKCVRCKEHARGKACYVVRGFSKREDATLYVYHHREDIVEETNDENSTTKLDGVDSMNLIRTDWCVELLDIDRQKEVRPVLCQNWEDIIHKFGMKTKRIEENVLSENESSVTVAQLDKPTDQNSTDLNAAFIQTPSKLNEITRKIAIEYRNDGTKQLQDKLRNLEEEQSKIKNNLLMEIIKSGVSLDDAKNEMQKKIESTFKSVSEEIKDSTFFSHNDTTESFENLPSMCTPKKIKREQSHKRSSSSKKNIYSKEKERSKHISRPPKAIKMSYESHKCKQKESLEQKDTLKRSIFSEKLLPQIRKECLENNREAISKIMAGKWI